MIALVLIDLALLLIALVTAGDALRQVQAIHYPAHAFALVLIVVVAFAGLVDVFQVWRVHTGPLLVHGLMAAAGLLAFLYPPEVKVKQWERS